MLALLLQLSCFFSCTIGQHLNFSVVDPRRITVLGRPFFSDRSALMAVIEKAPRRAVMVEVGSLAGFATRLFSMHFKSVISVDPYNPGYDDANDRNSWSDRLMLARDLFALRFFDDPRVQQLQLSSSRASRRFSNGSIDFVYIDACHTYKMAARDIRSWLPKVRPGGVIAGDDYHWQDGGVRQAVHELFGHNFEVIHDAWFHRTAIQVDDTPGWYNNAGVKCKQYESRQWCVDGSFQRGQEWTGKADFQHEECAGFPDCAAKFNYPELNCVVCGKGKAQTLCARPLGWCNHAGATYVDDLDCDGDGLADPHCFGPKPNKAGFLGSASLCRDSRPTGACQAARQHPDRVR